MPKEKPLLERLQETHNLIWTEAATYVQCIGEIRDGRLHKRCHHSCEGITIPVKRSDAAQTVFTYLRELMDWVTYCEALEENFDYRDPDPEVTLVLSWAMDSCSLGGFHRECGSYHDLVGVLVNDFLEDACKRIDRALASTEPRPGSAWLLLNSDPPVDSGSARELVINACMADESFWELSEAEPCRAAERALLARLGKEYNRAVWLAHQGMEAGAILSAEASRADGPFHPPKWFRDWNIEGSTLRRAAKRLDLGKRAASKTRWHYSECDARRLWPDKFAAKARQSDTNRHQTDTEAASG
jgi:hypothetical protein